MRLYKALIADISDGKVTAVRHSATYYANEKNAEDRYPYQSVVLDHTEYIDLDSNALILLKDSSDD